MSAGMGATVQSASRMDLVSGRKSGRLAGVERYLARDARGETFFAPRVEGALQADDEVEGFGGEDFSVTGGDGCGEGDACGSGDGGHRAPW